MVLLSMYEYFLIYSDPTGYGKKEGTAGSTATIMRIQSVLSWEGRDCYKTNRFCASEQIRMERIREHSGARVDYF
jgi:hypothetical protein